MRTLRKIYTKGSVIKIILIISITYYLIGLPLGYIGLRLGCKSPIKVCLTFKQYLTDPWLFTNTFFWPTFFNIESNKVALFTASINNELANKTITDFTGGLITKAIFDGTYNEPDVDGYHIIDTYKDVYGTEYRIDRNSNHITYFNAMFTKSKIGSRTTLISPSQAEQIGLAFAKKNIANFYQLDNISKYSFLTDQVYGSYDLTWTGPKPGTTKQSIYNYHGKIISPPPNYQIVIIVDKLGNIVSLQCEYLIGG
jgi:hypothetical protein